MEIPLFQWSQISKHPEWMPQINAQILLINIIVNKLLFLFKLVYLYTAQILLGH